MALTQENVYLHLGSELKRDVEKEIQGGHKVPTLQSLKNGHFYAMTVLLQ